MVTEFLIGRFVVLSPIKREPATSLLASAEFGRWITVLTFVRDTIAVCEQILDGMR
jgi:hypothetical protein